MTANLKHFIEEEIDFLEFLKSTMALEGLRYNKDNFTRSFSLIMTRISALNLEKEIEDDI
jgi:hypothetical protein